MGYFPFFVDLRGKTGLIVGGGKVALRKIRSLLPYGPGLRVVAPEICPEIGEIQGLKLCRRSFSPDDLEGCTFAIAATDDREVNRTVAELCGKQGIPVNVADKGGEGNFLFPSLVRQGSLSVGICTEGKYPIVSAYMKRRIEKLVPENMDDILEYLGEQRQVLKEKISDTGLRNQALSRLCQACMESGTALTPEKTREIISMTEDGYENGE